MFMGVSQLFCFYMKIFNKHLVNIYFMAGIVLGAWAKSSKQNSKNVSLCGIYNLAGVE